MNEDVRSTIIKVLAMLVLVFAEWWAMQPYHEPLLARLYEIMARMCYKMARTFGSWGLSLEANYYEVQA